MQRLQFPFKSVTSFVLGILLILCACSTPRKSETRASSIENKQLEVLLRLNDLNERAFVYHKICLKTEPLNDRFLENFKTVSNQLFDECHLSLKWKPEYIVHRLLERREYIQSTFITLLSAKGCQSDGALVVQDHYILMSRYGQN